jgi:hypothetical protein
MPVAPVRLQFRLTSAAIGFLVEAQNERTIMVPKYAMITVLDDLHESKHVFRQVGVMWSGQYLIMFAADILERAIRL